MNNESFLSAVKNVIIWKFASNNKISGQI
jgi:hypothetical protein